MALGVSGAWAADQKGDVHTQPHAHVATTNAASAVSNDAPSPSLRGRFIVHCEPTVRDRIDPVVTPGVYGRSHLHDFYGPRAVPREPSAQRLTKVNLGSSCSDSRDKSLYWHPTLLREGKTVSPVRIQAYYNISNLTEPTPIGLTYIAGSPGNLVTDGVHVRWVCGGDGDDKSSRVALSCEEDEYLSAAVSFPSCWDGRNLQSSDYGSHLAYAAADGRCPSSHPRHIPQLSLFMQWSCPSVCGHVEGLTLSSGGTGGLHADVIFNWDSDSLKDIINACMDKDCGVLENDAPTVGGALIPAGSAAAFLWRPISAVGYLDEGYAAPGTP